MAAKKRSHIEFWTSADSPFLDREKYRRIVLELDFEQAEVDVETSLVEEARRLGLLSWDHANPFSLASAGLQTPPPTPSASSSRRPSTHASSTLRTAASSASTFTSYRDRITSSRHSIVSTSTCPTFCSCNEGKNTLSNPDKLRARYSLDPARFAALDFRRPESRDRRPKFSLKHTFSRLPTFKKRSSGEIRETIPYTSACPEHDQAPDDALPESQPSNNASQGCEHSLEHLLLTSADEESVLRSVSSPQLGDLRSAQEGQRDRHLAFRQEVLHLLSISHTRSLEAHKTENEKAEQEMASRHTERVARLEENQLSAELSLIEEFKRERTALESCVRHMEAYFQTPAIVDTNAKSTLAQRQYTHEQRDRLRQKYHELDSMGTLHQSKIKVLRDRQARRLEESLQGMERDKADLAARNTQLYRDLEFRLQEERLAITGWLEARQSRLTTRWILEEAIHRKKLELETNLAYGPLPVLTFEEPPA